jgi:hypothetical protein
VDKLQENNFLVRYTHPNLLLISWLHYVPNYVRTEYKKKTGTAIDEFGHPILYDSEGKVIKYSGGGVGGGGGGGARSPEDANTLLYNQRNDPSGAGTAGHGGGGADGADKKEYKPTDTYRPTGNLVYNQEYFQKLENRLQ